MGGSVFWTDRQVTPSASKWYRKCKILPSNALPTSYAIVAANCHQVAQDTKRITMLAPPCGSKHHHVVLKANQNHYFVSAFAKTINNYFKQEYSLNP